METDKLINGITQKKVPTWGVGVECWGDTGVWK